jgi:hypothetical protein
VNNGGPAFGSNRRGIGFSRKRSK